MHVLDHAEAEFVESRVQPVPWLETTPIADRHLRNEYSEKGVRFFHPFTTTLVEIRVDREPMPLEGFNDLSFFPDAPERRAQQKAMELAAALRQRERDQARIEELLKQLQSEARRSIRR